MKPGDSRLAWLGVATGIAAVILLVFAEDLGSGQLYSLTLHVPGIDKLLHFFQSFLVCCVLSLLLGRTGVTPSTRVMLAAGAALAAAGFDELQQTFRADRNIELADVGAGAAGVATAVAVLVGASAPRVAVCAALLGIVTGGAIVQGSYRFARDYNRGVLAERDGRPAEALQHYLRGIDSGVANPQLLNAAAWLMLNMDNGDARRAVELSERALRLRPHDPDTLDTYGWALYRAGRSRDAVAPLEAAFAAKPDIYCIHYHLGMVYLSLDRRDDAVRHLEQQVERMPYTKEAELAAETLAGLHRSARKQ